MVPLSFGVPAPSSSHRELGPAKRCMIFRQHRRGERRRLRITPPVPRWPTRTARPRCRASAGRHRRILRPARRAGCVTVTERSSRGHSQSPTVFSTIRIWSWLSQGADDWGGIDTSGTRRYFMTLSKSFSDSNLWTQWRRLSGHHRSSRYSALVNPAGRPSRAPWPARVCSRAVNA